MQGPLWKDLKFGVRIEHSYMFIKNSQYWVIEENGPILFGRLSARVSRHIWTIYGIFNTLYLLLYWLRTHELSNKKSVKTARLIHVIFFHMNDSAFEKKNWLVPESYPKMCEKYQKIVCTRNAKILNILSYIFPNLKYLKSLFNLSQNFKLASSQLFKK